MSFPPGRWHSGAPSVLVSLMTCRDSVDGRAPWVWLSKEHQEKASGSTAVPPLGAPQPTVAVAETTLESKPITGANQFFLGVPPVTVTLSGAELSTGFPAVPVLSLAAMSAWAVACMSPQAPREQSSATAIAAASAPTCRRARSA